MEVKTPRKRRTRRPSFAKLLKAHSEKALLAYCEANDKATRLDFAAQASSLISAANACNDELDVIQLCLEALQIDPTAADALLGLAKWCTYTEEEVQVLSDMALVAKKLAHQSDVVAHEPQNHTPTASVVLTDIDTNVADGDEAESEDAALKSTNALSIEHEAISEEYQAVEDKLARYSDPKTGILTVSGLDGLFAALVSSPVLLTGEQWMPLLFSDGSKAPQWESTEEFMAFFNDMTVVLNRAADTLQDTPEKYIPLTRKSNEFKNPTARSIQDWCQGYLKIIGFWNLSEEDSAVHAALSKIQYFANAENFAALSQLSLAEQVQLFLDLSAASFAIYRYFEVPRNLELEMIENAEKNKQPKTPIRKEVEIGRNEPCPCGSGKKYKRCCL